MHKQTFQPGTYYIGDPCYPFPNEGPNAKLWDEFITIMFNGWNNPEKWLKFFEFHGHKVAVDSTAYGDGRYLGSDGKNYAVDAGCIGILPIELFPILQPEYTNEQLEKLGSIVTFDKSFVVTFNDGKFDFGGIYIDTKEDEEDEDSLWYEEDEDEDN